MVISIAGLRAMFNEGTARALGYPAWPLGLALVVAGFALTLGGCGGDSEPHPPTLVQVSVAATQPPSTTLPPSTVTSATTPRPPTTNSTPEQATTGTSGPTAQSSAPTAEGSVLQRRDLPPAGVAAQFDVFVGGGATDGKCFGISPGPAVIPWSEFAVEFLGGSLDTVPLGDSRDFCLPGFDPAEPISVSIEAPSGKTTMEQRSSLAAQNANLDDDYATPHLANFYTWAAFPTDELGTYSITASQSDLERSTRFVVVESEQPIFSVDPPSGPPGSEFLIGVAGFSPGSVIVSHLYGADPEGPKVRSFNSYPFYSGEYGYITSIEIPLGEDGRGSLRLGTVPGDPYGAYGFVSRDPPSESDGPFKFWSFDGYFVIDRAG